VRSFPAKDGTIVFFDREEDLTLKHKSEITTILNNIKKMPITKAPERQEEPRVDDEEYDPDDIW
jgi:hypothetical protein